MDVYHIWCTLKDDVGDLEFASAVRAYLDHLKAQGLVAGYRVTRRKLGLGPPQLPQWHITLDFENLAQMDSAFSRVSSRANPVESFHHAVNSKVQDVFFALYRDFPDPERVTGEEKF
jgi:hypothetical protein